MKRSKWMVLLTAALLLFGPIFAASPDDCKSVFDPPPNAHNKEEVRMTITDQLEAAFTRTLTGGSVSVQLTLLAGEKSDGCKFKLIVMDPDPGTGRCVFDILIGQGTVYYDGHPMSSDKVKIEVLSNEPGPPGMSIDGHSAYKTSDDCFKTRVNAFKLKLDGVTGDCIGSNLWMEKGYSYEVLKIKDHNCEVPTPATVPPTTAGPTGESTPSSPTGGSIPTGDTVPVPIVNTESTNPDAESTTGASGAPGPGPGPNESTTPGGSPGPTSTAEPSEFPPWAIAVIVVGAILLLVLVAVLIYCFCCRKKSDDDDAEPDAEAGEGGEAAAAPEGEATALEADAPEEDAKTAEELPENDANPAGEKTALGATPDDAQGTQDSEEQQKTQSNKEDDQPPAEDAK